MNLLIPLMSLIGPVYFAIRGSPIMFVLVWAAVWTGLRFLATWRQVYGALEERESGKPPSWVARHPSLLMPGVFLATLMAFEAVHLAAYWIVWGLVTNSS